MKLGEHKNRVYSCLRCGFCFDLPAEGNRHVCPPYITYGFESYGARGKLAIARALLDGTLELDSALAERLFACTECGACDAQCFKYLPLGAVYRSMKEDAAARGLIPVALRTVTQALSEYGNPYAKDPECRLEWLPGTHRVGRTAGVVLYLGCTPAYLRRSIARSAFQILEAVGVPFTVLDEEPCCGHPYISLGLMSEARAAMQRVLDAVSHTGAERVITPCPGCLRTFREEMPRLLGRTLPFEALHLAEYIALESKRRGLRFSRCASLVTYHDPCNLGRGLGVYSAPRSAIAAVPGVRITEMPRTGSAAFCCGHGGFVRLGHLDVARGSAADRWTEAVDTEAEMVLSACPACDSALLEARAAAGSQIDMMDLSEFLARLL